MRYIPGLNGLRAIAVFLVIFFHWELPQSHTLSIIKKIVPSGNFGVNLFFVLSGFLISSILFIELKKQANLPNRNKKIIGNFYIRRFLRIFPIYYLTLFVLYFTSLPEFRDNFIYHLTYTENYHIYFTHKYDSFCHTWSLAVEEQFYLIWPFVIIFTPRRHILKVLLLFICAAPAFSIFQTYILKQPLNAFILTPSCFDAFGIGTLIAYYYTEEKLHIPEKIINYLLLPAIAIYLYWVYAPAGGHFQFFKRTVESIICAKMILYCIKNRNMPHKLSLLENKVMFQLGAISYGLYLFHYAIPYFYYDLKQKSGYNFGSYTVLADYIIMLGILICLAFASFYLIEKPILKFKNRFKY